jgi:anti-sigma-K factor RskA
VNLQDYIASGIIESYVMGLASESERAEFEQMCAEYPALVAERRKFEESLEHYAAEHPVQPPSEVKVKVLEAIGNTDSRPASSNSTKIITMENAKSTGNAGWMRFVAAASVILVIVMAAMYYHVSEQNKTIIEQNKDLSSTNDRLKERLDTTQSTLDRIVQEQSVVSDPNALVVNMVGTTVAPKSSANIYWDSANTSVYLVVKNMPKLPSDKQYQLWALIDGKPRDLGVFDASDEKVILKMKNTQKAQAFAITIENKGGSPSPDLKKLQSMGKTMVTQ